jgi:hypothetical protein
MSSESDTPDIDEVKKTILPNTAYVNKVKKFLNKTIASIVHIFLYVIIAGYILFTCKVAQTNILPTETGCKPYTNVDPDFSSNPIPTNLFETYFGSVPMSQKLYFKYKDNQQSIVLDTIRQLKNAPTSTSISGYIMSIIQGGLSLNYIFYNVFFNLLNQLPEFLIVIIGPFLFLFFIIILFLVDSLHVLISWFTQLKWFFRKNENMKLSGAPEWSEITFLDPMEFFFAVAACGFMCIIGLITLPFLMPLLSIIFIILTIFSMNAYSGELNGEKIGLFGIVKKTILYYKVLISILISINLMLNAYSILGSTAGIFCFLTTLLIYFGFINFGLFDSVPEKFLSPLTSSEQAIKTCGGPVMAGGGKKEKIDSSNFNKKLKQISKQLKKQNN